MKKSILIIPSLLLGLSPLTSCNAMESISLYDKDSRFVMMSFDEKGSISLPTYRNAQTGALPYVELGDFFTANCALGNRRIKEVKTDQGYQIQEQESSRPFFTADPSKDVVTVSNFESWSALMSVNNNIGPDPASPQLANDEIAAVHGSDKSKIIGELKPETYDLSKYKINFVEKDGKCYAPVYFLSNLFYRWSGMDIVYNGFDYYSSLAIVNGAVPVLNRSYYASNKMFSAQEEVDALSYDPKGDESYRFAYPYKKGDTTTYRIISLTKDGKGKLLEASDPKDAGKETTVEGTVYSYEWKKEGDFLYVTITATGKDTETGETKTVPQGVQKIPLKEGLYKAKKLSKEVSQFNYNLLRFQFEQYYGIPDIAGYTTFDEYATKKGLKEGLLSLEADTYDQTLAKLLNKEIDDGHTRYSAPSLASGKFPSQGAKIGAENNGPRYSGLMGKLKEYTTLRRNTMGIKEGEPDQGLFIENKTAVLRFDSFLNPGSFVSNSYEPKEVEQYTPLEALRRGNVPFFFDTSFYQIQKKGGVENIVIDLTCNGGGAVMVLPYILAHMTNDPYLRFQNKNLNAIQEFHYKVDLNHDKVWGGEGDTYQGKYKFYILTSDFSFSCANFLPMISKELGVSIIGKQGGGGACCVGYFTDAHGSIYAISSPLIGVQKNGDSYAHTDKGVPVDHELASDSWYDLKKLDAFVNNLKK